MRYPKTEMCFQVDGYNIRRSMSVECECGGCMCVCGGGGAERGLNVSG